MAEEYRGANERTMGSECWTPFLKQLHVSSSVWTLFFISGLSIGAPTVIVPQIRKEWNATATIDDDLASWLYSISNLTALPWVFFLPALSQLIGRRISFLACCIAMSTLFALLYLSSSPYHILIAGAIQGFVNASTASIVFLMITEYCNCKYRNMYLNIQGTTLYWGIWTSNAIGTFLNWKYIAVLGLICSIYTFTISFHPESPRWLASKGKFARCKVAHRWLHGCSLEAEKELRDLVRSQETYTGDGNITRSGFVKMLNCKQFYMPLLLVILVSAQYNFSGKLVCSIYSIEILKKITNNESAAYTGMLIMDGVTVFGMYVGSALSKMLKMRTLFFSLSFFSICVMFTFSLYLYLVSLEIIQDNNIVTLGFLVVYSLAISSGPTIFCISIYSEIISIKYQAVSYAIGSFIFTAVCTGMLKFTPVIFKEFGIHGSFLFYGITCGITTVTLFIYLPELKNKTLEEIEDLFKDTDRVPEAETLTKTEKVNESLDITD